MRVLNFLCLIILPGFAFASEWESKYDDWTCYGKMGLIEQQYSIDSYVDNVEAENKEEYNFLCNFSSNILLNKEHYLLSILYPNCNFTTDNQLITIKVYKFEADNSLAAVKDESVKLSFPPNSSYFTALEVNRDQNVKSAFALNLLGQSTLNVNIENIGEAEINLSGVQKGVQNPSCVNN